MDLIKFKYVAEKWLNLKKNELRQTSYERYLQTYTAHLTCFDDKNISNINKEDIETFILKKENDEKLSESALYSIQFVLKSILDYSRNEYNLSTVEIKNRDITKIKPNTLVLSDLQKDILTDYVFEHTNSISIAVVLSLFLGLKTGEICALTKNDIDLKNNIIHIKNIAERVKDPISNKTTLKVFEIDNNLVRRDIPIPKKVSDYINNYIKTYKINNNDYLITQTHLLTDPRKIQKDLNALCKSLSLKCDFNTLRNTFISTCLKNNMNIKFLCKIIGNQNFKRIYELCPEIDDNLFNTEIEKGL